MQSSEKEFRMEDLEMFNQPLRQRLLEQAEAGLSHPVDMSEVVNTPGFNFDKINGYDPAHDKWHIGRVMNNAETLVAAEGGDLEVVWAIAAFHDIFTYKKGAEVLREQETEETAEYIGAWLKEIKFPEEKIEAVQQGIKESSFHKTFLAKPLKRVKASSKEAEIGFDADKLDQGGAFGVMRFCASSGRTNRALFNPNDPACEHREPEPGKYGMDLCKERSMELENLLYTQSGRNIAKRRNGFLNKFFIKLKDELRSGQVSEAQEAMQIFESSGKKGIQFYHPEDPFRESNSSKGQKRQLEPGKYAIDSLLENYGTKKFFQEFLEELKLELKGK